MSKSVFGLNENLAAALSYFLCPVTSIVFFVLEKDNKFVRFHALQAILFGMTYWVAGFVLSCIPIIRWILPSFLKFGYLLCVIYLMYMAYRGVSFKLPYIGDAAFNQINKAD